MRARIFASLLVILVLDGAAPVSGQSPELAIALRQYEILRAQGKYSEAEQIAKRALQLGESEFGPHNVKYASLLEKLADVYESLHRYNDAEPLYRRSQAIKQRTLAPDHPEVGKVLADIGVLYFKQGRYGDAEPLLKHAMAIQEKTLGSNHASFAATLNNLAEVYKAQSRYREAEALLKRVLAINEKSLPADHPNIAASLSNLGSLYVYQGRHSEAEQYYKRALAIRENSLGAENPDVAISLNNLGHLYDSQGRYSEAEGHYKRSLEIKERALGLDHPSVAISLGNLGALYLIQSRFGMAEPLLKRALAILEKIHGPDHPSIATNIYNLAKLYYFLGQLESAEPLFKRVLTIQENTVGFTHPNVAVTLNGLAGLYVAQGRYDEAEQLYKRSLPIQESVLGPEHADIAITLNDLAGIYAIQGRDNEIEPIYMRSLAILEKALGPNHPFVATALINLGHFYSIQGRYREADLLLNRGLTIAENSLGKDHLYVAFSLNYLGALYLAQSRFSEAEFVSERALSINRRILGSNHPNVATSLFYLALVYRAKGKAEQSLDYIRRAVAIRRTMTVKPGIEKVGYQPRDKDPSRAIFTFHLLQALSGSSENDASRRSMLVSEAFESSQLAHMTSTGLAVSRMAARGAAGSDILADLVRERQDAALRWGVLDKALIKALSNPPSERRQIEEMDLRNNLEAIEGRIREIDRHLYARFPQFSELSAPNPISLLEVQKLLSAGEAMLTFNALGDRTFVFAINRDRAIAQEVKLGSAELSESVRLLRQGLDPGFSTLQGQPIRPFNLPVAYELYRSLIGPLEVILEGAQHVFVVPDGALQSLPVGVLITKEPREPFADTEGYRNAPWLIRNYALTVLPSVSSLRALRTFVARRKPSQPFLGIGDPVLKGNTGSGRGIDLASLFLQRGGVNIEAIRNLPPLPDTADELKSLGRSLGAMGDALLLGSEATETRLKQMRLDDRKVLAFATHGAVAGELGGNAEPALVLTPPQNATAADDGLLTAGEVTQLKVEADWVILSACNTAAGDGTPGAEGLSGLAKAFFYAGSRALFVSHWPVASNATMKLTTRMLAEAAKPDVGKAEAHRRSMLALLNDPEHPEYAHPSFWAPFVVVGEGGIGH